MMLFGLPFRAIPTHELLNSVPVVGLGIGAGQII
jgi:hypothetical protein